MKFEFVVRCEATTQRTYIIDAATEQDARNIFQDGGGEEIDEMHISDDYTKILSVKEAVGFGPDSTVGTMKGVGV